MITLIKIAKKQTDIIDLFSGCGGLALGFSMAGYNILSGMEIDKAASLTASYNLHWKKGIDREHLCLDITKNSSAAFNLDNIEGSIVIGGPPCQAYSIAGRAKLRSLGKNRLHTKDKRGRLYEDFLKYVFEINANAVVMENVPESVNYDGENIPEVVCEILVANGYSAMWTILNSADYGVPQVRERVFVFAVKKEFGQIKHLPTPTHWRGNEEKTPNELRFSNFEQYKYFERPNQATNDLPNWITVNEALSDLPSLFPSYTSDYKLYKYNLKLKYKHQPLNSYQKLMRTATNGNVLESVSGNGFRRTKRDFIIFEKMKPGDNYKDAIDIAEELFQKACREKNITKEKNSEIYDELRKEIVPPYSLDKFLTKWRKLDGNKPSHTLVAHLGTDTYSHIHPWEPRGISVREAARLQSFPDDFIFNCNMGDAFKQIGNAVPPLLAKAVASALLKNLQ